MNSGIKKVMPGNIGVYQQLQKLEHINIIKILSCVEKDGFFLVEEEGLEGRTMNEILQEGKVTGDTFFDWILQICDALEYLYAVNPPITRVSLQPENILIGEGNVLKLIGFSEALNTINTKNLQAHDITAITSLMKNVDRRFAKKYVSLIKTWESGKDMTGISEFRKDVIEAYTSRIGIKRVALLGAISIIMLVLRVVRKLF